LIEHVLADDEMSERVAHAVASGRTGRRLLELGHVAAVLLEWYRRNADILVRFEEQCGAHATGIGDPISV
jgi:hypothetical protein